MTMHQYGPDPWFSTCTDLVVLPEYVHDVNTYYADLGVGTSATRSQLGRAYQGLFGDTSVRLTYVLHQVLNPAVRRAYDLMPLGSRFPDRYVSAAFVTAMREALGMSLDEVSTLMAALEDTPSEVIDTAPAQREDASTYRLGHFVLGNESGSPEALGVWKQHLLTAFSAAKISVHLGVGFHDGQSPFRVYPHHDRHLILLHPTTEPTLALAFLAQHRFTAEHLIRPHENRDTSMTTTDDMDFDFSGAFGSDVAKEEAAKKGKGVSARPVEFFNLDASTEGIKTGADRMLARFLNDHVAPRVNAEGKPLVTDQYDLPLITVDYHSFVPTRSKPSGMKADARWPDKMGAVCRNSKVFKPVYGSCYICDNIKNIKRAQPRTYALLVRREEVWEDGRKLGVRDAMKDYAPIIEVNGERKQAEEVTQVKDYIMARQSYDNFFAILTGFAERYGVNESANGVGTILDRDYTIKREGEKLDTKYRFAPDEPIFLADGRKFDLRNRDIITERYPDLPDLRKLVAHEASDEIYNRYFIEGAPIIDMGGPSNSNGKAKDEPAVPASSGSADANPDRLAAVRARLKGTPAASTASTTTTTATDTATPPPAGGQAL